MSVAGWTPSTCHLCDRNGPIEKWSGRLDSNQRPPAPKAGALPGCATPRPVKILDYPIPATSPGCRSPEAHTPPTCQNSHRCSYPPVSPGHAIVRVGVEVPRRGQRGHNRGHSKPRISPGRFRIRRRPLRALGRAKNAKLRANCRHQVRGWALNRPAHLRRPTPAARGETLASQRDQQGARIARRDTTENVGQHSSEEQREAGCIARRMQPGFSAGC